MSQHVLQILVIHLNRVKVLTNKKVFESINAYNYHCQLNNFNGASLGKKYIFH
jgi:hypothetical protein